MVRNRGDKPNTKFEKLPFAGKYSMKNIPIPKNSEYMKKLVGQMEKIVKRMRWRALFFLKEEEKYKTLAEEIEFHGKEEKYGFKSEKKPPSIKEMQDFRRKNLRLGVPDFTVPKCKNPNPDVNKHVF